MDKRDNKNILVQGASKPIKAAQVAITKLGELLNERGCKCHVGSKGAIPDILQKTGVPCARYPRKVVLIGWQWEDALAIQSLIGFTPDNVPEWFHSFEYNQIDEAIAFLE